MVKTKRYIKNIQEEGITLEAQEKLAMAKVLVMGAGGLGSGVIMNLAAMGVGSIKIIDGGIVEEENFNRQIIHKTKNIGRAKVMSAKDWIQEYNPDIKIELDKIQINELNYFNTIQGYNIIVDCFDNYEAKYMLNEIAIRHKKILIHAATKGFSAQVTTIMAPKTGCLCCVIPKPKIFKEQNFAALSPVINMTAAIQSQEVLKVITGIGEPLLNKLLVFDGLKSQFKILAFSKNMACECCSNEDF